MNTPRVEWKETRAGAKHHDFRAMVLGIGLGCSHTELGWEWFVEWREQATPSGAPLVKRSLGGGFCDTPEQAKAECEFFLSRELKARQWDEMQKEKA